MTELSEISKGVIVIDEKRSFKSTSFGFSNESSNANLVLTNLIKQSLKTSPIGTYTLQNLESGNYMWLCVPNNMSINEVTLNGFNVPMEASQDKQQGNITYRCYRSNHALIQGSYKVKIS